MTPAAQAAVAYARTLPPSALVPVAAELLLELAKGADAVAPESLLTIEQAARRLSVQKSWLYRHARHLNFTRKLSHRELRFCSAGLEAWLAEKQCARLVARG